MILSRRVALNGAQLDEVDERIIIQGIDEATGREQITGVNRGRGSGQRITSRRRDCLDVTVRFGINIKKTDLQGREDVLEAVNSWAAGGGWLTLGHRAGRRLRVVLAQAPGMGNVRAWTNEFALVFRAYGRPYWEDEAANEATTPATDSGGISVLVPGNAECPLDITVANASGAEIPRVSLTAGGAMSFEALGLRGGEALVIDHDEDGLLRIRIRSASGVYRSAMLARTPESDDDLIAAPGAAWCTVRATRAVRMTVSARGRWL